MTGQKEHKMKENDTAEWNSGNTKVEGGIIQMKKASRSKIGRKKEGSKGSKLDKGILIAMFVNAMMKPIILHANLNISRTFKKINKQDKIIHNNLSNIKIQTIYYDIWLNMDEQNEHQ